MRKFVVSDLHGNGKMYDTIISFLENINKEEEVILYINGDLIDRGQDSARMLLDVKNRIINNLGFKIKYLGGNHELMMYQASLGRYYKGKWPIFSDWFLYNGGKITAKKLKEKVTLKEENEIIDFVSNLDIYAKLDEKIDDKNIVITHAKCPKTILDDCILKIKNNDIIVNDTLWTRRSNPYNFKIGNKQYFTIIGHTPVDNNYGYEYYDDDNCINIDGGCARYANGLLNYNHTPLIEIDSKNNRLVILTFNNENEIIYGNYFINKKSVKIEEDILDTYKQYLENNNKTKKLVK